MNRQLYKAHSHKAVRPDEVKHKTEVLSCFFLIVLSTLTNILHDTSKHPVLQLNYLRPTALTAVARTVFERSSSDAHLP